MLLPILFQIIFSAKECGIVGCLSCDDSVTPNLCKECDEESYFESLNGATSTKCTCIDGWSFLFGEECKVPSPIYSVTLGTENNAKPEVGVKCLVTSINPDTAIRRVIYEWYRVNNQNAATKIDMQYNNLYEYTIVGEDVGYKIRVKAIGNESKGFTNSATSTLQDIVVTTLQSVTLAIENNARPRVGIKCQVTDIQPPYADGKITYEWYRVDDQDTETSITVEDSSSKEYTLTDDDVGYKIKVKATGIGEKGCNGETTSILSSTVLLSVISITLITENNAYPKVGVKCQITDIQPADADGKLSFEWYRVDEQGTETLITLQGNPKEHTLTGDDVGYKIKVKATGIEAKGYAGDTTSILEAAVLDLICPIGCQCDAHSDICKSCKSDEHFIEKVGSDPKECECDSNNGYAFGSDSNSEKCVCDSTKHLIPGTDENIGNCVCEPDYKGDTINGCKFDKCAAFDQNCDQCDDDDNPQQCTHCKSDEYGISDSTNKCVLCKEVTNDNNCKTCQLNDAAYKCLSCIEGQIDGNSCTSTTCTTKNCATCTPDGVTCFTCKEDFILTSTKQCQSQIPLTCKDVVENCKTCEQENGADTSICSECNEGFFLDIKTSVLSDDTATKVCTKCSDNCKTCKSVAECQICKDNFGVTSNGKCEQCSNIQHVNQETHKCVDNCKTGNDLNKCKTCDEKDKSICGSCNEGSSLVEGKCIPTESPKQCPTGCICEDDKSVCKRCQPGFKEKKENNILVSCDPDFTACNPEVKTKGCMYCLNKEPFNECALCNMNDDNMILEPNEDGICICNKGYELENGRCVPEKADCTTSIPGCTKCFKDNTKSCAVCNEVNGYNSFPIESLVDGNNICSCKVYGFEPNEKGVCATPNESKCNPAIPGCLKCTTPDKCDICDTTKYYQSSNINGKCQCIEGYEINSQGVCNKPANSECNANIIGCLKCGIDKNKCIYCDTESNFVLDEQSKCVCDDGFELNKDGQCIEILEPAELITGESIPLSSDYVHKDPSNANHLIINTKEMEVNSPYAIHYNQVEKDIKSISIEENQHDNIYLILPTEGDLTVTTKKEENSKCNLMLPMEKASSTDLTLMKESTGITIINYISDNILNLKSSEQGTIRLANLSTQESVKVSPQNDVEFEFINIFQNGKVENTANDKKIFAKHITVQRGAKGILKGVEILEDLIVGPSSTTEFGDDVKYSGKTINIKYSRSQAIGKSFFTGIFKEIPKEIKVSRIDSDLLLDDESKDEEMLVAEGSKNNFNPEICKSWAKMVSGDFGRAKCDESDSTNNKVIAIKSDNDGAKNNNKKKLSGGEIAGIVIACVVVVVVVVALLVYFLVFKKKKDNSNSENGDSSLSV